MTVTQVNLTECGENVVISKNIKKVLTSDLSQLS